MSTTQMAQGRYGASAAAWKGRVYIFGGSTPTGMTGAVEVVNPGANKVATLGFQTMPRRYAGAATIGDAIFVVGGFGRQLSTVLERVDPATGKVVKCRPLPNPHLNAVTVAANDRLWVIGGSERGGVTAAMDIYDPSRDSWEKGPPLPVARECAGFVHDGLIHIVGGYDGSAAVRRWDTYVVSQGRWVTHEDLPSPVSANHLAVVGDTALSFGDYSAMGTVRACDLRTGRWYVPHLPEPFEPRRHAAVASTGSTIVVAGGNTAGSNSYIDTVQIFQL